MNNNTVPVLFTLLKKIFNYILITCRNNDHLFHYFYWHIHSIYWLISKDINKTHEWSVSGPCRLFFFRQNKNRFQLWVVDVTKHLCHSLDRKQWRKISHQRDKIIIQLQIDIQLFFPSNKYVSIREILFMWSDFYVFKCTIDFRFIRKILQVFFSSG